MRTLIILLLVTIFCSTSMAGVSGTLDSWYDDILEFFNLNKDDGDDTFDEIDVADSSNGDTQFSPSLDTNDGSYIVDSPLLADSDLEGQTGTDQLNLEQSDPTVISTPVPGSILLSGIGLGIAGYLRRRRAI